MCGIAGAFGFCKPDQDQIGRTLSSMVNRGPDGNGTYQHDLQNHSVTLLHTRLAILDIDSRSDQPFVANGVSLTYNGELYNYRELRKQLEGGGHKFLTMGDTEVVLRSYLEWGTDCFDYFEGMWAFALFDQRTSTLLLSRDRFGEKPLYYSVHEGTLYFASEVKAIATLSGKKPLVNYDQVRRYLVNGYKSLYKYDQTFFSDVSELPAATFACLQGSSKGVAAIQPQKYWSLEYAPQPISRQDALEAVREKLECALSIRLRADVPIAFCLSGGVDSTALISLARREFGADAHAFSVIDSDERYDESENISDTVSVLNIRHTIAHTRTDGFIDRLEKLVSYHDAPVATISYVVHEFLSQAIHDHGYKVAISGTAADELFSGYYDHYGFWLSEMKDRPEFPQLLADWRNSYGRFVTNPILRDPMVFVRDSTVRAHIFLDRDKFNELLCEPVAEDFEEREYSTSLLRQRMMNELFHESVPVLLHEDDLNSMKWSVENRSPFLDRSLAELLFSIPNEHLIHQGRVKSLLREAVAEIAPKKAMQDRRKRGFNASIDSMLDKNDPYVRDWLLADGPIFDVVKKDDFRRLLDADTSDASLSKFMFSFVATKAFLESELVSH